MDARTHSGGDSLCLQTRIRFYGVWVHLMPRTGIGSAPSFALSTWGVWGQWGLEYSSSTLPGVGLNRKTKLKLPSPFLVLPPNQCQLICALVPGLSFLRMTPGDAR